MVVAVYSLLVSALQVIRLALSLTLSLSPRPTAIGDGDGNGYATGGNGSRSWDARTADVSGCVERNCALKLIMEGHVILGAQTCGGF